MTCSCSLGCKVEPVLFCLLIGISPSSVSFPSLLVGVLQRNRANMMCVSRQIYYKELVIPCIQLWKLASPESAGWAGRLRTQESRCSGLSPKAAHDTGEVQRPSAGEFSLALFLFCSSLQPIGWGSPTLWWAIAFRQSSLIYMNLNQKCPHRNTQNNVCPNIWAPQDSAKLTYKVNHHTF